MPQDTFGSNPLSARSLLQAIRGAGSHRLARNVSWLLIGQALNFLLQAGFFILLARLLGAREYGIFAGAYALVSVVTPYTSLGTGVLFMRYVSGDPKRAPVYWGNGLLVTTVMTVVLATSFPLIAPFVIKTHGWRLMFQLVLSNCFFSQIVLLTGRVFQTYERMKWTATLTLLSNLIRFCVLVLALIWLKRATAVQWSTGVMIASAASAAIAVHLGRRAVGSICFQPSLIFKRMWEGLAFSLSTTTQAVYNDFDKTLLSHYSLNVENGFYTLAYRVIDFAATPVGAVDAAVLPRFFALGHSGRLPVLRLAIKSVGTVAAVGAITAGAIWVVTPLVPHLVGRDFNGVRTALYWLCIIPLLRGIHTVSGSALTATQNQHKRLVAQMCVAALNLILNVYWIPRYGWIGAAWSSVASDGALAVINLMILSAIGRKDRTTPDLIQESIAQSR